MDNPTIIPPHDPVINRNNIEHSQPESPAPGDPDVHERSNETRPASDKSSASSREWKAKRLIITYFLPIVMAWLGGSISGAVADLL